MGAALSFLILAAAGVGASPGGRDCPNDQAVLKEIERLGAARAMAAAGTTEVSVQGSNMRIVLRRHDGTVLGLREIAAPDACEERAVVAAVVVIAWIEGDWSSARARQATPPPPSSPFSPPAVARAAAAPAPVRLRGRGDVGPYASGVHDGDAGTWGLGIQASYGGERLAATALAEETGQRSQPLGPVRAAYQALRFGVGLAARGTFGRGLADAALVPEAIRLSLKGEGLDVAHSATSYGLAVAGRARLGLRLASVVPFVYADLGYGLTAQRLSLDDRPDTTTLSRWNVGAGLGVLLPFGPPGR